MSLSARLAKCGLLDVSREHVLVQREGQVEAEGLKGRHLPSRARLTFCSGYFGPLPTGSFNLILAIFEAIHECPSFSRTRRRKNVGGGGVIGTEVNTYSKIMWTKQVSHMHCHVGS